MAFRRGSFWIHALWIDTMYTITIKFIFNTPEGKDLMVKEYTTPGLTTVSLDASDTQINERVKLGESAMFHSRGTADMGNFVHGVAKGLWSQTPESRGC